MNNELPKFNPTTAHPSAARSATALPPRIGTEHPSLLPRNGHLLVERTFIFSDIYFRQVAGNNRRFIGFTGYRLINQGLLD